MIITGIFVTSIFLSIVKANWIVLHRSPLNVSDDNIGNGIFSDTVAINNENLDTERNALEQTTTEAVNVERFLENLSNVYNDDHVAESTTEMSIENDESAKRKDVGGDENQSSTTLTPTEPLETTEISSSSSTTTSQISSTSSQSTTTIAPSIPSPNPCLITDNEQCEITCSNTNSTALTNALSQLINGLDLMDYPECPFTDIKLKLVNIRFIASGLVDSWLGNIGVNILELRIENPQTFTQIVDFPFDSEQFSTMETLVIYGGGTASLNLESEEIFIGATSLKTVIFSDFLRMSFEPFTFSLISTTLKNLEISKVSRPTSTLWSSLSNLLKDSNLRHLESLDFRLTNFTSISLFKNVFEPSKDSLKIINVANSNVVNLTSDTFAGCTQLKELRLENNLIQDLSPELFDNLVNLESLFLQNNQLKTLPDKLFDTQLNAEKLAIVDLSSNPWYCDTSIFYLKNFLLHTTAEVTINTCEGPESLYGRSIHDLWCNVDSCKIKCEFTARRELLAELEDLDMSTCTEVELHLKYHTFNEEMLSDQWLSKLDFNIYKLTIAHSNIKTIKNGTFNSPVFEKLKELTIYDNNETDLVIEEEGLIDLKSIEILKIESSTGLLLNSDYSILEPIRNTLKEMSVSLLLEPFDPRLIFGHTELKNLKTLHLTGNKFEFIEFTNETFGGLHENLEELFMIDSMVTNITADAFSRFQNLKTIDLSGNNIESLDGQFLGSHSDKKFVSINLSNLNLKFLDVDTFNGCKQLRKLSLNQNSIASLSTEIFDDLENLEILLLQDNLLTNIPENLFKIQLKSGNLQLINFTNNPWNCDPEIIHLKQFLMETEAEILINGCSLPLSFYGEDIKDLWCRQDECNLICERTDDTTLPVALQIFEMSNCDYTTFHLIAHNFINRTLTNNSLSNLKFNVDKMHFERTDIESIQNYAFKLPVFENLQELKISQITKYSCYINQYGLSGLNSIEVIIIENLKELITFTSYSIFSAVQSTVKKIQINGINDKINVFHLFNKPNFTSLQTLQLTGNVYSSEINSETFRGAHKILEEMSLRHTRNMTIAADAFSMFVNLKFLDFIGSELKSLDGRFFGNCAEKKFALINFSNTSLESLGNDTFAGCKQLKTLDLSGNSLSSIELGTFDDLENLESLYLQNNFLDSIPRNLFKSQLNAEKLKFVDLSNNPWDCDVGIIGLKHFLEFTKAEIIIDGCTKPDNFRDKSIKDLWCVRNSCTIECEGTDDHLALLLDYPINLNCDKIELRLTTHKAYEFRINSRFLSNLNYNIQKLVIDKSFIEEINDNAFDSKVFENLESFVMTKNYNSCFINSNVFAGLNVIEYLEIDQSPEIKWFSASNILSPIRSTLKEVRITNIKEDFNPSHIFEKTRFEKLKILNLNGNDLKKLNESYFVGAHDTLEELHLRNSKISKLYSNTFAGFKNLKLVNLVDNKITSIESSQFGNLLNDENFKVLISGNPWDCTCEIEFLLYIMADEGNVTCKTPEDLSEKRINELEELCYVQPTTTEEPTTTITEEPTTTSSITTTSTTTTTSITDEPTTTTTTVEITTISTEPSTRSTNPFSVNSTLPEPPTTPRPSTTTVPPTSSTLDPENNDTTTSERPLITTPYYDFSTGSVSTTTSPRSLYTPSYVTCFDPDNAVESTSHVPWQNDYNPRYSSSNIEIPLPRPDYDFKSITTKEGTYNEVIIEIDDFRPVTVLLYYPSSEDPFANDKNPDERFSIRCITVSKKTIFVKNLAPNVIYNFCLIVNITPYISPFQCRSYQIVVGKPWLYEQQKPVILTSLSLLIVLALIVGIIMTYCLIRQIPTLIKGSKRVVLVNNRAREVMILPRSSTQSSNQSVSSSCHKESVTPIHNEAPTYLTPLPRQSFDQRPPFPRSSSDTSLKSYVSVSRLPPRFSQVYQRDDFDSACYKHHMSYPHCAPSAPYQPVSDIPPPLPRRSIVSNSSSTQHSCASTAELGRTMSRAHNSTYRRHPRPIEIEQENHYNVII